MYGRDFVPGRDSFFNLLRRKGLMLPKPKPRHTTNSNHRYHKWKNRIKDFVPTAANQLWVADITYIPLAAGDVCYLHLITDAYSHKVVGWILADTLRAAITLKALDMAIEEEDTSMEGEIKQFVNGIQEAVEKQEVLLLLGGEYDQNNAILTFHAGAGGTEAQDWC